MTCWRLVPDANTLHHLYSDFVNVNELALSGVPPVSLVPLCTSTPFYFHLPDSRPISFTRFPDILMQLKIMNYGENF